MPTLLDKLMGRTKDAGARLREVAAAEAAGKSHKDGDNLAALFVEAGTSAPQFQSLVELHRRAASLREQAAELPARFAEWRDADKAAEAHKAETERILKSREAEQVKLYEAAANQAASLRQAECAKAALEILEYEHAEVLGLAPPNLDNYTLTSGGTTINRCDESAPGRAVDGETFTRETSRRIRLVNEEHARIRAAHIAKCEQVRATRGEYAEMPACGKLPEWVDVVKTLA